MPYKKQTATDKIKEKKAAAARRARQVTELEKKAEAAKKATSGNKVDRIVSQRLKSIEDDATKRRRTTRKLFLQSKQERLRKEGKDAAKKVKNITKVEKVLKNVSKGVKSGVKSAIKGIGGGIGSKAVKAVKKRSASNSKRKKKK